MSSEEKKEMSFEELMEDRMQSNFAVKDSTKDVSNERLKAMNKKLPSWSLEPPYSFLK